MKLDLEVPPDDPENDERCRSIERGAKLVTAMPTNMSLVLQMPRGNLETVFPRAMVVAGIRNLIEEKNYTRAFSYCRTQRVDMNILYDHRPEQFLDNVSLFLEQLADVAHIDLFLSSLRYVYINCPLIPPSSVDKSQGRGRHEEHVQEYEAFQRPVGSAWHRSGSLGCRIDLCGRKSQHSLRCCSYQFAVSEGQRS